jgi:multiple sugar transport system permease protein
MALSSLRTSRKTRRELRWGLIFISPWIVGFCLFSLFPTLASAYYSVTDKALVRAPDFVGLDNYVQLLRHDPLFFKSVGNTLYMVVTLVPLTIVVSFVSALLLNTNVRGVAIYRTLYYLPVVVPPVASVFLWLWILNPQYGLLNTLLSLFGVRGPGWFADPRWSKPAILLLSGWGVGGSMVLYLAALQGVPRELYESATIDGANFLQRTLHITVPLVSPVTLFITITTSIGAFQIFTQAFVASGVGQGATLGDPRLSLLFYAIYLYHEGFVYLRMGYASAMAWILFLIILVATFLLLRTSNIWTHYET